MSQDKKFRRDISLTALFLRNVAFTAMRVLIIGWYFYFGLHFSEKIEPPAYLYLLIFPLSVFGLWELTGLPKKIMKLVGSSQRDT